MYYQNENTYEETDEIKSIQGITVEKSKGSSTSNIYYRSNLYKVNIF